MKNPIRLRLTTQGRYSLSGFTDAEAAIMRPWRWMVLGVLKNGAKSLVLLRGAAVSVNPSEVGTALTGVTMAPDRNTFLVPDGQKKNAIAEEVDFEGEFTDPLGKVYHLQEVRRFAPPTEKQRRMEENPVRPEPKPVADPEQPVLFDGVITDASRKKR